MPLALNLVIEIVLASLFQISSSTLNFFYYWYRSSSQISVDGERARLDSFLVVKVSIGQGSLPILQLSWRNKHIWLLSKHAPYELICLKILNVHEDLKHHLILEEGLQSIKVENIDVTVHYYSNWRTLIGSEKSDWKERDEECYPVTTSGHTFLHTASFIGGALLQSIVIGSILEYSELWLVFWSTIFNLFLDCL